MDFGQPIKDVKEFEPKGKPAAKGYVGVITAVEDTISKSSGNPMLVISADIADGEFKGFFKGNLKDYMVYNSDVGKGKIKALIRVAQEENPSRISAGDFTETTFNEQKLVGCEIGLVLGWDEKGYLDVRYFTTKEKAFEAKEIPAPQVSEAGVVESPGEDDLPF